jgi:heat shock protein 5
VFVLRRTGDSAKNAYHTNPKNTVFDAKRLIGRKGDDADIKRDMKHWPFNVKTKGGKPIISVTHKGEEKDFTPEEVRLFSRALCHEFKLTMRERSPLWFSSR